MSLEQKLRTAVANLGSGQLANEAQVKLAVILPVLRALGWDESNPSEFKPEYSAGLGLVDYALLDHESPLVFVEAKRLGALGASGERQLFGYAANRGVPLLVLTDGKCWDFYLSMAQGVPAERCFYRLELQLEHKIPEYARFFEKLLQKNRVVSGEAKLYAEHLLKRKREEQRAKRAIPTAWDVLLKEPDDMLCDLLVEKVESECGTKPKLDDVETFLRNFSRANVRTETGSPPKRPKAPPKPPRIATGELIGFTFNNKPFKTANARLTLARIIEVFESDNSRFMEQFATRTTSRRRKLIAKNRSNLYKESPHLIKHSTQLENGWWLGTNLSKEQIIKYIKIACYIADVEFGVDLILNESKRPKLIENSQNNRFGKFVP